MADEAYMSYEQVLQELQINRSEMNRLIRDGRLKDHVISGETKFRRVEVTDLKKAIQKRPTVMAQEGAEPTTDVLLAATPAGPTEPETEILEGEPLERETDVLAERPSPVQERDTEVLEEEPELELESRADRDVGKPLSEATPLSESALETDLELQAVRAKQAPEEEDFFDFTDTLNEEEFELEGKEAPAAEAPAAEAPKAAAPAGSPRNEEADELVGDILGLEEEAAGAQVSEEELLSEIMDIEGAEEPEEETADITADITTMEEPTYDATELEDVLAGGGEEEAFGDEFAVPIPEHVGPEAQATKGMVIALVAALIILIVAGLFVVDNGGQPAFTGGATSWALKLTGS